MAETDRALETALAVLDGAICECGHVESSHVFDPDDCHGDDGDGCDVECREFRPVDFQVRRASVREPT